MVRLHAAVDDIENVMSAGYTVIRIYTGASSTSADYTSLDGTVTLVAEQTGYTYVDTDGDSSVYYKIAYYGATPGESDQSPSMGMLGGTVQYYANVLDVRQEFAAGATDDAAIGEHDDDIIWDMCEEASRLIDGEKRVEEGAYLASSSTSARYFTGSGDNWQAIDPATSITAIEVEETDGTYTAWTIDTDCYLWPYDYDAIGEPVQALEVTRKSGSSKSVFNAGPKRIKVTGTWGVSSTVLPAVRRAARIQVARWYKRAQQGWSDAGASVELGQLIYVRELDPDVARALRSVFPHTGAGI